MIGFLSIKKSIPILLPSTTGTISSLILLILDMRALSSLSPSLRTICTIDGRKELDSHLMIVSTQMVEKSNCHLMEKNVVDAKERIKDLILMFLIMSSICQLGNIQSKIRVTQDMMDINIPDSGIIPQIDP